MTGDDAITMGRRPGAVDGPLLVPWLAVVLAFAGSWLLVANPGYFSHDELQWAARAGTRGPIPWAHWAAIGDFQYRPLTFDLWLWLSRHLFERPAAFHALLVAWGAANTGLLCALGRRLGMRPGPALVGALAFALGPFATYVHGWVGTLGDIGWLTAALLLGLVVARAPRHRKTGALAMELPRVALVPAVLTLVALLFKEAAVSIPALLALAWWLDGRRRHWGVATLAAGAVVAVYIALRAGALLHAPRAGTQYALAMANVPARWLDYQLFAPVVTRLEPVNLLAAGWGQRTALSALLWLGVVGVAWRSDRRLALAFVLGGLAALAPVLALGSSFNQYGYAFAAITAMAAAAAWAGASRGGRALLAVVALLCLWHGVNVMRAMRHVGEVQAVFSPALADAVRRHPGAVVSLRPDADASADVFARLTHEIPGYDGVLIGDRVRLVAPGAPADLAIAADGHLRTATPLR